MGTFLSIGMANFFITEKISWIIWNNDCTFKAQTFELIRNLRQCFNSSRVSGVLKNLKDKENTVIYLKIKNNVHIYLQLTIILLCLYPEKSKFEIQNFCK